MHAPDDPELEVGHDGRLRRTHGLIALLLVLGAFRLLVPGDVRFVNDEPRLIESALDANELGTLVSAGLPGTRGVRYGPAPTWFYQLSLVITSDPVRIAVARIVFVTGLTALAITMLARTLSGVAPILGAFAFLSPYQWLYARDLWDNSFSVPLSAMLLAAYAQFCRAERLRWLAVAGLCGTLCLMTHLMTLPLVGAIGVHFAVTRWRAVLGSPRLALGLSAIAALCLAISLPYLTELAGGPRSGFGLTPRPARIAFALNGMRLFSLGGLEYFIGPWRLGGLGLVAKLVSLFSYVAGAFGLLLVVRAAREGGSLEKQLASVLLLALGSFVVLANGVGLREHPHYYNGVWIVFFCLWWTGMSGLVRLAWARRLLFAQVMVMAVFLVGVASWIHSNRGTRTLHYGATLENQMAIARELDRLGAVDAPPSTAIHPRLFPHAIGVLRRLQRRSAEGAASGASPGADVVIEYADPGGSSGELSVRPVPAS